MASKRLTKPCRRALEDLSFGDLRQRSNGRWSMYPNGEFSSRTVWDLEAAGLAQISSATGRCQITNAGRATLSTLKKD